MQPDCVHELTERGTASQLQDTGAQLEPHELPLAM